MMKRIIIGFLLAMMLFPAGIGAVADESKSTIYVFADLPKSKPNFPLYANGLLITVLKPKTYKSFEIHDTKLRLSTYLNSPITSDPFFYFEREFDIQPGGTHYYKYAPFKEIDESQAEVLLKEYSPVTWTP
jgi:hypothetical protein